MIWKNKAINIGSATTLFWFRRDLRIEDNAGLYHALKENKGVLPLFIFDTEILERLEDNNDRRVEFIHQSVGLLKNRFEQLGSSLFILHGNPVEIFRKLKAMKVYANHDYEPYGRKRDDHIKNILKKNGIEFRTFKDHVVFERDEIVKTDGKPYTIYTPYSSKWKSKLNSFYLKSYPTKKYVTSLLRCTPLPFPELKDIGFVNTDTPFPDRIIKKSTIVEYGEQRNFPGIRGTTRLSLHLRFGTVSIRTLAREGLRLNEIWLNELIWRDFYQMILWHFPHVATKAFKGGYDRIEWRNDPIEFAAWCEGKTGYPIVDAGMRELNSTGFMHNRVRMVVASFLTKHLLIDWRWGEAYFATKLLDFDLASNNGGWQWAAGSGCDAAPYFRVFSPLLQTKKFDPLLIYVRHWVPEVDSVQYPNPIVDHKEARERALRVYKKALKHV